MTRPRFLSKGAQPFTRRDFLITMLGAGAAFWFSGVAATAMDHTVTDGVPTRLPLSISSSSLPCGSPSLSCADSWMLRAIFRIGVLGQQRSLSTHPAQSNWLDQ